MAALVLALLDAVALVACDADARQKPVAVPETNHSTAPTPTVRGINFSHYRSFGDPYPREAARATLAEVRRLGIEWIAVIPAFWQDTIQSTSFEADLAGRPLDMARPIERGIEHVIADARDQGFKVFLKPHLWVRNKPVAEEWHGTIRHHTEGAWREWFANYATALLAYARFAAEHEVDALSIGVELSTAMRERGADFARLVAAIRKVYSGRLTYCANWWEDFDKVDIWRDLDWIAVDFFFPLAEEKHPDPAAVAPAFIKRRDEIEAVSRRFGKPYLLSEVGFRSADFAYGKPWTWTEAAQTKDSRGNAAIQAQAYALVRDTFAGRPDFLGLFWWYWLADNSPWDGMAEDFSPRGKPAAEVVQSWFGGRGK